MATISYDESQFARGGYESYRVFWENVTTGDEGLAYEVLGAMGAMASIQVTGTFNGGTTVTVEVSNDGSTWATANDLEQTAMSFTAAAIKDFTTGARYIRVAVASGSSDDIDATLILRG